MGLELLSPCMRPLSAELRHEFFGKLILKAMAVRFQDWFTNILGIQSVAQFGAQQPPYQRNPTARAEVECSSYLAPTPPSFETTSLSFVKDGLAVLPEWSGGSVSTFTYGPANGEKTY